MIDFKLYLITDRSLCTAGSLKTLVAQACRAGVRAVQLREKDLQAGEQPTHILVWANLVVFKGDKPIAVLHPGQRFYPNQQSPFAGRYEGVFDGEIDIEAGIFSGEIDIEAGIFSALNVRAAGSGLFDVSILYHEILL
jgi:hypothetical protein